MKKMGSVYQLEVGGKRFALDLEDIEKLGSSFLTTLVDPESNFAQPRDGIFTIEADSTCFDAFLFLSRYGILPQLPVEDEVIMAQADFWGLRDKVSAIMRSISHERCRHKIKLQLLTRLTSELVISKRHHNYIDEDQGGRLHCTDCGYRIIIRSFLDCQELKKSKTKYTQCKSCNKTIFCSRNLGCCHKCSLCRQCQVGKECPNDSYDVCTYYYQDPKTTNQLKKEIEALKTELDCMLYGK